MPTQTYKVASGDTLSAIAKKYGVKVENISGYRSGDINKIYPGEVLNIPTTAPTLGLQPQPITTAATTTAIVKPPTIPSTTLPLKNQPPTLPLISQQQITTQPPIITTTPTPKVGTSQIDAGKTAIQELTTMGVSSDINTIRNNWSKFGLNTKLGEWIGSAVQWNAYGKYAKDELERIKTGLETAQKTLTAGQEKIATEGVTPTPTEPITPTGRTTPTTPLTPEQLTTVQLSSTDIGDIINEIEAGTAVTPETVIAGEAAKLLTDDEKARAGQALTTFQQQMAKAGQSFSSIRSSGEAAIAAESLSRQSGISLDLASKIVDAARKEQTSRVKAIQAQQDASNASLKAMGYTMVGGQLFKTLERQKFEQPEEPKIQNVGGNLVSIDPTTGAVSLLFKGQPDYKYFTDEDGNVTEYNPETGEMGNLGKLGAARASTGTDLEPIAYTGKYDTDFLATRAKDFVSETGEVDWEMIDDLENTDKALWNDMTMFMSEVLKNMNEIEESSTLEEPSPEAKGFLNSIGDLGKFLVATNPFTTQLSWLFGK